jgi:hypothetical protein
VRDEKVTDRDTVLMEVDVTTMGGAGRCAVGQAQLRLLSLLSRP